MAVREPLSRACPGLRPTLVAAALASWACLPIQETRRPQVVVQLTTADSRPISSSKVIVLTASRRPGLYGQREEFLDTSSFTAAELRDWTALGLGCEAPLWWSVAISCHAGHANGVARIPDRGGNVVLLVGEDVPVSGSGVTMFTDDDLRSLAEGECSRGAPF